MRSFVLASALVSWIVLSGCSSTVEPQEGGGGSGATSEGGNVAQGGSGGIIGTGGVPSQGGGGADGGGGIGEPSDVYPAPHPPAPQAVTLGGPVMADPVIVPIYFAADDQSLLAGVTDFINQVGDTEYWAATTAEYGVGPASSLPPIILDETAPNAIDDTEIQALIADKINAGDPAFPTTTENTLYAIYFPFNTTVTADFGGGTSVGCQDFGAYHSNLFLDGAHGNLAVPYAVMPRCGDWGQFTGVDALTIPSSHEFIEAATDPLPLNTPAYGQTDDDHIIWALLLGGEVGDLCAQDYSAYTTFPGDIEYGVQRSWSNAAAAASHHPCAPSPAGQVYFNASVAAEDSINLGQGFFTKGIIAPVGQAVTVDVPLFSDGPTDGPWYVEAEDVSYFLGVSTDVNLTFDESEGQNGQVLHLTIEVNDPGQYGIQVIMLHSYLGDQENTWLALVANG